MKPLSRTSLLWAALITPAILASKLVAPAHAQDKPEFQDVPRDHWAYAALQQLIAAGLLEGTSPSGYCIGPKPLTRYEFAIATARVISQPGCNVGLMWDLYVKSHPEISRIPFPDCGPEGPRPYIDVLRVRLAGVEARKQPDILRPEVRTLIVALSSEFKDDIAKLGARVDTADTRVTILENGDPPPPRFSNSFALQAAQGDASYISNFDADPAANTGGLGGNGRIFLSGAPGSNDPGSTGTLTAVRDADTGKNGTKKKFSYTDFEIRMTDRVTDRLMMSAALRSLGDTSEDPWTGNSRGVLYIREANAAADLSHFEHLGIRGLSATLGRQRTKIGSGLLYDNDLAPTDDFRADFTLGPFNVTSFAGSSSNNQLTGGGNPYATQGAIGYLRQDSIIGTNTAIGFPDGKPANNSVMNEDNEAAVRVSATLFHLNSQPAVLGLDKLADGYGFQRGRGADLSLPLFGHTVGLEYVQQEAYATGGHAGFINGDKPEAYTVNLPILKSDHLDLNLAYGRASRDFEFFAISSANPYARTYGSAIFDRPNALGAPMLAANGQFVAAKKTMDFTGSMRILHIGYDHQIPLNFRFYDARDGFNDKLGRVYSLGTTCSVVPGLDVEIKGGIYAPEFGSSKVHYLRIGAGYGF